MPCSHALDTDNLCVYRCDTMLKEMLPMREMTDRQIAYHLLFVCLGDSCNCCDWADGDRSIMENMSLDTAQHIVDTVSEDEDFDISMLTAMDDGDSEDSMTDAEADADTLRSCGWGTDEDYGYYGED